MDSKAFKILFFSNIMEIKEEVLIKEFDKDYFHPNYLSKFNIHGKRADMSAIVPTYNRCPFDRESPNYIYNPLHICIKTLLLQKSIIKEIVVIDDASTDYTKEVVDDLKKEAYSTKGVEIKYILNKERKGSSISRNIGAKQASSKYLFFLDDDCIPAPYLSFISMIVIKKLEEKDKHFSVLVLPTYNRSSYPRAANQISDLTRIFFKDGLKANFQSFPEEYVKAKDKFLNKTLKILKPIQIYQTWGHFVIDRSKYLDVGGFPEFATWPNKAGEEQEFACRLIENAYTLYYLPGTKASSYHGAYGAKIRGGFKGLDWLSELTDGKLSLAKFSRICNEGIMSGNRVSIEDACYSMIIAVFCITYKRNTKEAINWAKKSYQGFVVEAKKSWFPVYDYKIIEPRRKREEIWHRAMRDGLNLLMDTERNKMRKLNSFTNSLKIKGRIEEEKENRLKRIFEIIYNE